MVIETQIISDETWKLIDGIWDKRVEEMKAAESVEIEDDEEKPKLPMMCGSSALPLPIMQQWETITRHQLLEHYGMTEFVMAISNPVRGKSKGGTIGRPFLDVQKLMNNRGAEDQIVRNGESHLRSSNVQREMTGDDREEKYQDMLQQHAQTQSNVDEFQAYYQAVGGEKKKKKIWPWILSKLLLCVSFNRTFKCSINTYR